MTVAHVQEALDRLPETHRNDPNMIALVSALVRPAQSLETALQDLLTKRQVDTAVGTQLDVIGRRVGQARNGLADTEYRRYIIARIWTNRSNGTREDAIRIARLVVDDGTERVVVAVQGVAAFVLRVENIAVNSTVAEILISFLRAGAAAGVRVILESNTAAPHLAFRFTPTTTTFASLSLLAASGNIDTVVEALEPGTIGNAITVRVVSDSEGLVETGNAVTIYVSATTTISKVEQMISTSKLIRVKTASASGATLATSLLETPVNLASGVNGNGLGFARLAGRQLNEAGLTANVDTFVRARAAGRAGRSQTIRFAAGGVGSGVLTDGVDAVFGFQAGVTTVGDFQTALAASEFMFVYLSGTAATVMTASDVAGPISMIGGQDGGQLADARA